MENWERMFAGVQRIVWEATSLQDGMTRLLAFAAQQPDQYDEPDYWQQAAVTPMPFDTIMGWVREGGAAFAPDPDKKLAVLVLDCGDAPDLFLMQEWRLSASDDAAPALRELKTYPLWSAYDIEKQITIEKSIRLAYHNVDELKHPILSWNHAGHDYAGDNGYLLWLAVAALAWRECLRDVQFCQSLLKSCDEIFLLVGYEEIFFYFGRISEQGFEF
jgi:hypothetical protein